MANNLRFFRGIHLSGGNAIIAAIRLPRGGQNRFDLKPRVGLIVEADGQARRHASVRKIRSAAPLDGSGLDSNSRGLLTAYKVALEFEFILLGQRVLVKRFSNEIDQIGAFTGVSSWPSAVMVLKLLEEQPGRPFLGPPHKGSSGCRRRNDQSVVWLFKYRNCQFPIHSAPPSSRR